MSDHSLSLILHAFARLQCRNDLLLHTAATRVAKLSTTRGLSDKSVSLYAYSLGTLGVKALQPHSEQTTRPDPDHPDRPDIRLDVPIISVPQDSVWGNLRRLFLERIKHHSALNIANFVQAMGKVGEIQGGDMQGEDIYPSVRNVVDAIKEVLEDDDYAMVRGLSVKETVNMLDGLVACGGFRGEAKGRF